MRNEMNNKFNANKHRSNHVFRYYSKKNACSIKAESFLEYIYLCIFECDPKVVAYASQPESIHISHNGKNIRYTPDLLIQYKDDTAEYIEVHHSNFTDDAFKRNIEHFSRHTMSKINIAIRIVSEKGLCKMTRTNYELISSCMSVNITDKINTDRLAISITLHDLITKLAPFTNHAIANAYYLIATGFYTFDMSKLLQSETILRRVS